MSLSLVSLEIKSCIQFMPQLFDLMSPIVLLLISKNDFICQHFGGGKVLKLTKYMIHNRVRGQEIASWTEMENRLDTLGNGTDRIFT